MICLRCVRRARGSSCPDCGGPLLPEDDAHLETLAAARLRRQVARWRDEGRLDAEKAAELEGTLPPVVAPPPGRSVAQRLEDGADAVARTAARVRWPPPWLTALRRSLQGPAAERPEDAVEAVAALDEGDAAGPGLRALLNEYVWWFIGTLLVLAGSVMGVREAWRTLEGAPRQLVVAGALLTYHAGFVALSVLVGRRSPRAGRVLGGLAVGLLPVVFVALSALAALSSTLGAGASAGAFAVAAGTLAVVGRTHANVGGLRLWLVLAPSLLAMLPVAADLHPWQRALLPAVGVLSVVAGGRVAAGTLGALATAVYGAAALGLFALFGAPGTPGALDRDAFVPGTEAFAGVGLWGLGVGAVLAFEARRAWLRRRLPHLAPTIEIAALACVAAAALGGVAGAFALAPGLRPDLDLASAAAPALAAAVFGASAWRRPPALHAAVAWSLAAAALAGRLVAPDAPGWWAFAAAVAAALLLLGAARVRPTRTRALVIGWGVAAGAAAPVAAVILEAAPGFAATAAAGLVALAAHASALGARPGLHFLGAAAFVFGLWTLDPGSPAWLGAALAGAAVLYGAAARLRATHALDDVSLIAAICAIPLGILLDPLPPAVAGATLLARAPRDRSRAVAFAGALGLAVAAYTWAMPLSAGQAALALAGVAAAFALVAAARAPAEAVEGRWFLDFVTLPYGGRGRALFDAFAAAALPLAALAVAQIGLWLGDRVEADRALVVAAALLLVVAGLAAFALPGFAAFGLRASSVTLAAVGVLGALAAVVYRIGRERPPATTALRMTLALAAIWLAGRALARWGPALAAALGRPGAKPRFADVADVGVAVVGALLLHKAATVGWGDGMRLLTTVPPLAPLGAALAAALLARARGFDALRHVAAALLLPAAALAAAQGGLLGPALVRLYPDGFWTPEAAAALDGTSARATVWLPPGVTALSLIDRAALGLGAAATLLAAGAAVLARWPWLRRRLAAWGGERADVLRLWTGVAATGLTVLGVERAAIGPAAIVVVVGLLLAAARGPAGAERALGAGALLVVHAHAHAGGAIPAAVGPGLGAAALALVLLAAGPLRRPALAADGGAPALDGEARWTRLHLLALVCLGGGVAYALAAGGLADATAAATATLDRAGAGALTPSVCATLALAAATLLAGASQWRGPLSASGTAAGWLLAGAAAVAWAALPSPGLEAAAPASLALAAVAALAHTHGRRRPTGARFGRDALLLATCAALAPLATGRAPVPETALAALALLTLVGAHAAWRERTPRHVYLVQAALAAAYGLYRTRVVPEWPAEADAVALLVFGFALVGVVVVARRAGVPPVADAVRRFAALLPIAAGVLLGGEDAWTGAATAAGSGLLYGALALVERSRGFGALAALAGNLALLNVAFAEDVDGVEVYLALLGLFLILLAQLYSRALGPVQRKRVRVLGGLLLYVPAAIQLAMQVGPAADGTYAIVFGAVCLLGVAAGMMLRVRAFLALGTGFLTLDVIANLVHASLRDHRVGFLVMSVSGLLILGAMILVTTRRDSLLRRWQALRRRLRGWE